MSEEGFCLDKPRAEFNGGLHHPAKVRRIVQLFMNGGASQMDTFDYKPTLEKRHGEKIDFGLKAAVTSPVGTIMKSPFEFKQYGQCGRWVSSVFPQRGRMRRRSGVSDGDGQQDERARPGQLHAKHGLCVAGISVDGRVDFLRAGQPQR